MNTKIIDGKVYTELEIADIYIDGNKIDKEFKLENSRVDLLLKLVEPINIASDKSIVNNTIDNLDIENTKTNKYNVDTDNSFKDKKTNKCIYGMFIVAITIIIVQAAIIFLK